LLQNDELRAEVGAAAREEVSLWDWKAATMHLLDVQYPAAMAAAAVYYGNAVKKTMEDNTTNPSFA
jgi:sulfoquinovosyltransferase